MIFFANEFELASKFNLLYLVPVIVFSLILIIKRFIWQKRISSLLSGKYNFLLNFSLLKKLFKSLLFFTGLLFLSFSLLKPRWGYNEQKIAQEGRDLLIALDVSRSMLAQDLKPNRLDFAKNKIKNLVDQLNSDRVGLIIFSGQAFVQCPLTHDKAAFFTFLDSIDAESISTGTTALDLAINKSIEIFNNNQSRKNKLLAVFTDGEDFSSNLTDIRNQAQKIGLKIFTFGIGTEQGAPIPLYDDNLKQVGHQKDDKGNIVISKLNDGILRAISNESGAKYIKVTEDETDLKKLINYLNYFEKEKYEDKEVSNLQEKYYYFALISLICFLLEWIL